MTRFPTITGPALVAALLASGLATTATAPARAETVYANSFDTEAGGATALGYTGFTGLTVTKGTVDVVKNGDFGVTCAGGGGSCVDLDGTIFNPGGQLTSGSYAFGAGETTTLSFLLSATQSGFGEIDFAGAALTFGSALTGTWGYSLNGIVTNLGSFAASELTRAYYTQSWGPTDPFDAHTLFFTPDSAGTVSFSLSTVSNNGTGPKLDNLALSIARLPGGGAVPEPGTWAMLILGFGVIGAAARRQSMARGLARSIA